MKALRRFLTLAAVLIMGMAGASAIDSSSFMSQYLGDASQEEFEAVFNEATEEYFLTVLEASMGNDATVQTFRLLDPSNLSDEEEDMISAVEEYLAEEEVIDTNELYMVMAIRNLDLMNSSMDAWIVFSHLNERNEFTNYVYYIDVLIN